MATTAFSGFPEEALDFYAGLLADNSKTYWEANRARWERSAKGPMVALLAELEPEFGPFHLFRPYRDVRFSRDKTPYKTWIAAVGETEGGTSLYLHLGAEGLLVANGMYVLESDQLARYRAAVADDLTGPSLARVVADLVAAGYDLGQGAAPLKRAPKGVDPSHPRIDLLRRKGLIASKDLGAPPWLQTPAARERIAEVWRGAAALHDWLGRHVGPSQALPPEAAQWLGPG